MSRRSSGRPPARKRDSGSGATPTNEPPAQVAAGALCWRTGPDGGLEVLLVHSARWGDWSWPKGKQHRHESLPACAVREAQEETGARIQLGMPLPTVSYVMPDGIAKTVHYWAARVRDSGPRTASADEISEVAWLPVRQARERLSRPGDRPPLDTLLDLAERDRLDTRPLLVLRHAKAKGRARWPGEEEDRPLTRTGRQQAQALPDLLACWAPDRILSSPWERCRQTLQPYLDQRAKYENRYEKHENQRETGRNPVEFVPLLTESGLRHDPVRITEAVTQLLAEERSALVCTHRPVLAVVVDTLADSTALAIRDQLPGHDPWLAPAEILVVQVGHQYHARKVISRIQSVEFFRDEIGRNARS